MWEKSKFMEIVCKNKFFPEKCFCRHVECSYVNAAGKFLPGLRENMNQSLKIVKEKLGNLLQYFEIIPRTFPMDRYEASFVTLRKFFLVTVQNLYAQILKQFETQKNHLKNFFTQVVPLVTQNAVSDTMTESFSIRVQNYIKSENYIQKRFLSKCTTGHVYFSFDNLLDIFLVKFP